MVKKISDKKIGRVDATTIANEVSQTTGVGSVGAVKPTSGVGSTSATGGIGKRRATRVMTMAEREELFKLVSEEAERMFPPGTIPPEKREVIEGAVRMAIDAAIEESPELEQSGSSSSQEKK